LLQANNARFQEDAQSKSTQLDQAVKIAATARKEVDSLRKELGQLKKKLKEEEKEKAEAQVQKKEREDLMHKSTMALLGNFIAVSLNSFLFRFIGFLLLLFLLVGAADISADYVGKLRADSVADAISMAIESGEFVRSLLQKNKAVLSRFHAMIFPKADQNKTLGHLVGAFSVDTEGIIEVFKHTSHNYGALLAF
jgi:sRNA-binding carbon storage regulator CsrA